MYVVVNNDQNFNKNQIRNCCLARHTYLLKLFSFCVLVVINTECCICTDWPV